MQNNDILNTLPDESGHRTASEYSASAFEENPFLRSLHELKPEHIVQTVSIPAPKRRLDLFTVIKAIVLLICLAVMIHSLRLLVTQIQDTLNTDSTYSDIADQFWGVSSSVISQSRPDLSLPSSPDYAASQTLTDYSEFLKQPTYNEKLEQFKARLGALKEINKDIYGYIYIEGTKIDYPLVQHSDNSYYLDHDFTGRYCTAGAIFVDYRNRSPIESNRNTILYGHHMFSASTMFHTLDNFFDEEFFLTHPDAYIYTFDGIYRFKVFAVYITKQDYHYIRTSFASDEAFVEFCEEMRSNSLYYREDVTFTKDSHLLTLSTCTNIVKTDRICVQAVLEEIET